jgi:hypothetical protein
VKKALPSAAFFGAFFVLLFPFSHLRVERPKGAARRRHGRRHGACMRNRASNRKERVQMNEEDVSSVKQY